MRSFAAIGSLLRGRSSEARRAEPSAINLLLLAKKDAMRPAAAPASADLQGLDIDSLLGGGDGTLKLNF